MASLEISQSLARLSAALDLLAAAAERRAGAESQHQALAEERHLMEEDRDRLAAELDASLARQRMLEEASQTVETRLDVIGESLRAIVQVKPEAKL